jgi:hypothetical protein
VTADPENSSPEPRFAGAHLTGSAFPDDVGTADPAVTQALAEHSAGGSARSVQQALLGTRLLVPVVAMLEESEVSATGATVDKQSSMATVTVVGANGKSAVPVFTSMATMLAWRPDARPSAVSAEYAAVAALQDADALLIDPAGPHRLVLAGAGLHALAAGRPWLPLPEDADLLSQLNETVADLGARVAVVQTDSAQDDADLIVQSPSTDAEATAVITQRIVQLPALRERVERGVRIRFERHAGQ